MKIIKKIAGCRNRDGSMDYEKLWGLLIRECGLQIDPPPPLLGILAELGFKNPIVFNGCFRWRQTAMVIEVRGGEAQQLSEALLKGQIPLSEFLAGASEHTPLSVPHPGSPFDSDIAWGKLLANCGFNLFIDDNWVYPPMETNIPYGYYVVNLCLDEKLRGLSVEDAYRAIKAVGGTPLRAIEGVQLIAANIDLLSKKSGLRRKQPKGMDAMCFLGSDCPNWHGSEDEYLCSFFYENTIREYSQYLGQEGLFWGGTNTGAPPRSQEKNTPSYPYFKSWAKL